jgi:DNA primase
MTDRPDIAARIAEVKRRLSLAGEIERAGVKLSGRAGAANRRGKCLFHGSNSASFSVKDDEFAHCFGCGWNGDVIRFLRDHLGLDFMDALREAEARAGIDPSGAANAGTGTVHREKQAQPRRERQAVEPIEMARWLWKHARPDAAAVRRYFTGRGVPAAALTDARIAPFRFMADAPCWPWRQGEDPRRSKGMLCAPAIMALVCCPTASLLEGGGAGPTVWKPVGLHVTWLNPEGDGTMQRRAPWAKDDDADPMLPKRRMLGPVGKGAVILGDYHAGAHLFVGEGNETVLSAIGLAGAGGDVVGVAALSLDNLQGGVAKWKNGVWPLHAIKPDPERPCFTIPGHRGAVTGLIDSDMAPLRGPLVRPTPRIGSGVLEAGAGTERVYQGEKLVLRKGGPIVSRAITGAERATICAELVVQGWRAIGAHPVSALRAPMGMDFNDAAIQQALIERGTLHRG